MKKIHQQAEFIPHFKSWCYLCVVLFHLLTKSNPSSIKWPGKSKFIVKIHRTACSCLFSCIPDRCSKAGV